MPSCHPEFDYLGSGRKDEPPAKGSDVVQGVCFFWGGAMIRIMETNVFL